MNNMEFVSEIQIQHTIFPFMKNANLRFRLLHLIATFLVRHCDPNFDLLIKPGPVKLMC